MSVERGKERDVLDHPQFDTLAKRVWARTSRRAALAVVFGAPAESNDAEGRHGLDPI